MSGWRVYLGVARARFLLLAVCCVSLAAALAWPVQGLDGRWMLDLLLVLIGAVAAHASVNALNEYSDFRSGLDLQTRRTPFSGGSGTLPAAPESAGIALWGGIGGLLLCGLLGGYFMLQRPVLFGPLLGFGLAGGMLILLYTPWLTRHPWLCLPAPGAGFGLLMLPAAVLALGGACTPAVWVCGVIVCLCCNNLLLVNQLPDQEADARAGRLTMPMLVGLRGTLRLVVLQWSLAIGLLLLAVLQHWLPVASLILLVLAPLGLRVHAGLGRDPVGEPASFPHMAGNVALTLLVPLLLAAGVLAG